MFLRLGRFITAHPWIICICWVLTGLTLSFLAPSWNSRALDDDIHFLPERCDSVRGYKRLAEAFPEDVFASRVVLVFDRVERELDSEDLSLVERCAERIERLRTEESTLPLGKVVTPKDPLLGQRLRSRDGHCALIQVSLSTPFLAQQTQVAVDRIEAVAREVATSEGAPQLLVTGPAGVGRDLTQAGGEGLDGTTLATILLVIGVLLFVYRAPLLALVPLATIGIAVWVAIQGLALLTLIPGVYLVHVSKVFAIVLLYGAGTDYCLFLISRYREELNLRFLPADALSRSVGHVGGALTASAGTVVLGLGMMGFAEFAKLRCSGPAIALSLVVALLASLTLTPALLAILGRWVFWPGSRPKQGEARPSALWIHMSDLVVSRPWMVFLGSTLLLSPLAILGVRLQSDYRPMGELSPKAESIQGLEVLQKRFTAGETGPVTILLTGPRAWSRPETKVALERVARSLAHLDNVAEVRALTRPLGTPLPDRPALPVRSGLLGGLFQSLQKGANDALARAEDLAQAHYLATLPGDDKYPAPKYVTRLDVVLKSDPFSTQSLETLELLQVWLTKELPRVAVEAGPLEWETYGVTVNARDLARITAADRARVNVLVLGGILLLLLAVVKKLWLALYLLLTVLFSYLATLGAVALAGWFWRGEILTQVDWRVPFFLFTILVAVGEDYNIFIITRALEERRKHGAKEAMRRALATTGGTISSCGIIMAGTFGTLMLAGLGTLVQTGFALAFGVLLDTFVVRPFLVPAFTLLVWRWQEEPKLEPMVQKQAA